jgi:hypothetical protein
MFKFAQKQAVINGWVCPSHPEIIWDAPGKCPRCRQELAPGTLPRAATLPASPSARRQFLQRGLIILSGLLWLSFPFRRAAYAQGMGPGRGMGPMDDRGIMGGGGMMGAQVPEQLPTPTSQAWLSNLREVLSLERLSLVQYQTDEDK